MKRIGLCLLTVVILLLLGQPVSAKDQATAQDFVAKADALVNQGAHGEAIKGYSSAIELDPNLAEAYFKRGKASFSANRTLAAEALIDYNRAVELKPDQADYYHERALINLFLINNENALRDFRTAATMGHEKAKQWLAAEQAVASKVKVAQEKDKTVAEPRMAAAAVERTVAAPAQTLTLQQLLSSSRPPVVHFAFDKADLQEGDLALLDEIATVLTDRTPQAGILVAGHTDGIGAEGYNEQLSQRRARAVVDYLTQERQVAPGRFQIQGYGPSVPVADNKTAAGRTQNRRAEVQFRTSP